MPESDERRAGPEPEERHETTQEGMAADEGADAPAEAAPETAEPQAPERGDGGPMELAGRDYIIPGVDADDPDPYKWHTGQKRDHGGQDAIEVIDLVKQFGRMRILNQCNLGLPDDQISMVLGPSGTGKSVIATQLVCASANRGEPCAMFLFEERAGTLLLRAEQLGMNLRGHLDSGLVTMHQVDPAELAPDQFTHLVRRAVVEHGARVVVIDSLNGYFTAMPEARFLTLQMHELLSFLADRGVATILTVAQAGIVGQMTSPIDVSYLADTVVMLRYFEAQGRMRKAISVVKKRSGRHEDTIRELTLDERGVHLGPPLEAFRGVFTGVPVPGLDGAASSREAP